MLYLNLLYNEMVNKFKLLILILSILLFSCSDKALSVDQLNTDLKESNFDVVEKKLIFQTDLPVHVIALTQKWFDNKVKLTGFEGEMIFIVDSYNENISKISNGKKIEITLDFSVIIKKTSKNQEKFIKGKINTFGSISGTFSLKDFDNVIENTQSDLIVRLSNDLNSKI